MNIYERFAYFYVKGPYLQYSERIAEPLPAVLERFSVQPQTILDLACGEGTFAVGMAEKGFQVTVLTYLHICYSLPENGEKHSYFENHGDS